MTTNFQISVSRSITMPGAAGSQINFKIPSTRPDSLSLGVALPPNMSAGVSSNAKLIENRIRIASETSPATPSFRPAPQKKTLDEKLYDALAAFKVRTATIAMHLDRDWRNRLFFNLDSLLKFEDWESDDLPPTLASFSTFLRMIMLIAPSRRPGLGATSDGNLIAAWTVGEDRLTIECTPNDVVRWHLSANISGERERVAAITPLRRLKQVLQPYGPERWFADGDNVLTP